MVKKKRKNPLRIVQRSGLRIEPLEDRRVLAGVSIEFIEQMLQSSAANSGVNTFEGAAVVATFDVPQQDSGSPDSNSDSPDQVRYWIETTDPRFEVVDGKIRLIPNATTEGETPPVLFVRCQANEAKVPLMTVVEDYRITYLDDTQF